MLTTLHHQPIYNTSCSAKWGNVQAAAYNDARTVHGFTTNLIKKSVTVSNDKLIIYLLYHIKALLTDILETVNLEWQID